MIRAIKYGFLISSLVILCKCGNIESDNYPIKGSYAELHTHILSAELSIYENDRNTAERYIQKIATLLNEEKGMFCAHQNNEIESTFEVVHNLKEKISFSDLNYQLEQLRLLKKLIFNLDTENEIDFYNLYLWNYEEQMYYSTKAAKVLKLDLYEWDEFMDEVKCLSESWAILNHHYPSPELLDYNQLRYKTQVVVKSELSNATKSFVTLVIHGQADVKIVSQSAEYLRKKYREYLSALVRDPMSDYAKTNI